MIPKILLALCFLAGLSLGEGFRVGAVFGGGFTSFVGDKSDMVPSTGGYEGFLGFNFAIPVTYCYFM